MHMWVSWKPGRYRISFLTKDLKGYRYNNILVLPGKGSLRFAFFPLLWYIQGHGIRIKRTNR
jgi:hypothetical protein